MSWTKVSSLAEPVFKLLTSLAMAMAASLPEVRSIPRMRSSAVMRSPSTSPILEPYIAAETEEI